MKKTYKAPMMKAWNLTCEDLMATSDTIECRGSNELLDGPFEAETKGIGHKSLWDIEW